jgi:hypothetical protein
VPHPQFTLEISSLVFFPLDFCRFSRGRKTTGECETSDLEEGEEEGEGEDRSEEEAGENVLPLISASFDCEASGHPRLEEEVGEREGEGKEVLSLELCPFLFFDFGEGREGKYSLTTFFST